MPDDTTRALLDAREIVKHPRDVMVPLQYVDPATVENPDFRWFLKHADMGHAFRVVSEWEQVGWDQPRGTLRGSVLECGLCPLVWPNDASDGYPPCPSKWSLDEIEDRHGV